MSDDTESRYLELRGSIGELKKFIDSPQWKQYSEFIDAQVKGRTDQLILAPLAGIDAAFAQEYAKGEIQGLRLCLTVLPQLIEDMEAELTALEPNNE